MTSIAAAPRPEEEREPDQHSGGGRPQADRLLPPDGAALPRQLDAGQPHGQQPRRPLRCLKKPSQNRSGPKRN